MRDFSSQPRRGGATTADKVMVGVAAAVLAGSAVVAVGARRDAAQVAARLEQVRGESQATMARAQQFEARQDPSHLLASQALLTAEAPPSRIVSELSRVMPGDVRLEGLQLAYGSRLQVEMRVSARNAASYDAFLERLERSPSFTEVLPGDENRQGELRAVVRAVWRGAGA